MSSWKTSIYQEEDYKFKWIPWNSVDKEIKKNTDKDGNTPNICDKTEGLAQIYLPCIRVWRENQRHSMTKTQNWLNFYKKTRILKQKLSITGKEQIDEELEADLIRLQT